MDPMAVGVLFVPLCLGLVLADDPAGLADFVDHHCLACHEGRDAKAGMDLSALVDGSPPPQRILRLVRDRLRRRDMPPLPGAGEESSAETWGDRPDAAAYDAAIAAIDAITFARAASATPGRPGLRRLNRHEYRTTVRTLIGVDLDVAATLPADDVGEGFDHIGDVLSMPPSLLAKYLDLAERAAMAAWPDDVEPSAWTIEPRDLAIGSQGRAGSARAVVWSSGDAVATVELPREGRYRIVFRGGGEQAGDEPVKVAVKAGGRAVAYFDLPEAPNALGERTCEAEIGGGRQRIAISFLNDYFRADLPEGARDRNLHLGAIRVEGPIDRRGPTAAARRLVGAADSVESLARRVASGAFRRPVADDEVERFSERIRGALASDATWPESVRIALTAALVDPRFLFRIESDPAPAEHRRLDGYELATRLSYFLWSAPPDDALLEAASEGRLGHDDGLFAEVDRLLDDPRSIALAEHFGQQWLFIRDLEERRPDPMRFERVDAAMLADLKAETTLFLDAVVREDRPVDELLAADWSYLNERLARHYGIDGVDGSWMRRVHTGGHRVPGLLGHASVLIATSNPTRTSPVKRGRWVLEALLDEAPPPPPPGTPLLIERGPEAERTSMRERLALHRASPDCASCHRRMDEIGFALETLDAVGRPRTSERGEPIDARGDLPDGRTVDGPRELAALLRSEPAFARSYLRHLMTYALGRGLRDEDLAVVERLARDIGPRPTARAAIRAIVGTGQFRGRSGPSPEALHRAFRTESLRP